MAFLRSIWKAKSQHKKLSEEQALQIEENLKEDEPLQQPELLIENEDDVITFKLKYLGSTVVEKFSGDNISTEAVKNIIKVSKVGRKKLQRVNIAISLKGISVIDLQGNDVFKVSIYSISNCSTDSTHRQVFSFVSTDENETMECHAFICSKRKTAETVTLAVAHAFSTAYEAWRILPTTKEFTRKANSPSTSSSSSPATIDIIKNNEINIINTQADDDFFCSKIEEKLIDFDDEPSLMDDPVFVFGMPSCQDTFNAKWVCFDDDFANFAPENARNILKNDMILA